MPDRGLEVRTASDAPRRWSKRARASRPSWRWSTCACPAARAWSWCASSGAGAGDAHRGADRLRQHRDRGRGDRARRHQLPDQARGRRRDPDVLQADSPDAGPAVEPSDGAPVAGARRVGAHPARARRLRPATSPRRRAASASTAAPCSASSQNTRRGRERALPQAACPLPGPLPRTGEGGDPHSIRIRSPRPASGERVRERGRATAARAPKFAANLTQTRTPVGRP